MTGDERARLLVVDDELPALEELAFLLGRDERVGPVRTCQSATQALRLLQDEPVDGVFLDVAMPGLDGVELAAVLARFSQPPPVVFVTAHDEHAVRAFEVRAVDFLLKPVREDRLREAVRRVLAVDEVRPGAEEPGSDDRIAVELGGVTRFLSRSQVHYVSAEGDYVRLHTADETHLLRTPLGTLADAWAEAGFVRVHRSLLVALAHVSEVRLDRARSVVVVDGQELPVSRRHTPQLRQRLRRTRPGEAVEPEDSP